MSKRLQQWLQTEQGRAYSVANDKLQAELERVGGGVLEVRQVLTPQELTNLEAGREVMRSEAARPRRSNFAEKSLTTIGPTPRWIN